MILDRHVTIKTMLILDVIGLLFLGLYAKAKNEHRADISNLSSDICLHYVIRDEADLNEAEEWMDKYIDKVEAGASGYTEVGKLMKVLPQKYALKSVRVRIGKEDYTYNPSKKNGE